MAALTESQKERLLVERVRAKDQQAFGELVERYQKSLYNVIFGVVSDVERTEDVVQETFLRAYRFIERYDASFRFSTWLRSELKGGKITLLLWRIYSMHTLNPHPKVKKGFRQACKNSSHKTYQELKKHT